jgi:hypothetical protein
MERVKLHCALRHAPGLLKQLSIILRAQHPLEH